MATFVSVQSALEMLVPTSRMPKGVEPEGRCRFLRTKAGKSYFAHVWLEVEPGGATVEVRETLPDRVAADEGEVNRHTAPAWMAAALDGIRASLAYARQTGVLVNGCQVALLKLVGSPVDTREDVVRCAAGLAVWDSLAAAGPAPEAEFDGQTWNLVFPARMPGAAQGLSR